MVELAGAVVTGQVRRQGAELGELPGRESMQPEAEQIVGLVGIGDELLEAVANFYPARVGGGGVVSRRRSSRLWAAHTNPSVTAGSRS